MTYRLPDVQKAYDKYLSSLGDQCNFCIPTEEDRNSQVEITDHFKVISNLFPYHTWDMQIVHDHLLIVPLRHVTQFTEFSPSEAAEFLGLVAKYEADGYSMYSRAASNATRTIPHHHTHLLKLAPPA